MHAGPTDRVLAAMLSTTVGPVGYPRLPVRMSPRASRE